jgi:catechol 2,3-dioxygenase-like lactoylglutathione lyase family enzyme
MTVPARVSLVTLGVGDLARSTAFYRALGWAPSSISGDEVSFFATSDCVLALYPIESLAADLGVAADELRPSGAVTLAINVGGERDVAPALAEAVRAGATLVRAAERTNWGGTVGYFADPDGHVWEVAHNPGFPFDERGSVILPG